MEWLMNIRIFARLLSILTILVLMENSYAFCGFYAARAGSTLYNQSSKVVIVQDNQYQSVTMASDFKGNAKDFAMVVPVPKVLKRHQINVVNNNIITHLDNYTAPRLVEYFDRSPCQIVHPSPVRRMMAPRSPAKRKSGAASLGVKIEARYAVGVYDILLLSAQESNGLVTWLKQNKYQLPKGAEPVINSYLAMGLKFFVAKVNMQRQAKTGFAYLKPIRITYHSPNFMLPIRLGMLNANGPQELFVYHLNRKGRVITTNYPNVKLSTNKEIPVYVKKDFGTFYKAMFENLVKRNGRRAVFLEYAWDMNWCDPCAADPLSNNELKQLGVFWVAQPQKIANGRPRPVFRGGGNSKNVFVTRLHLTYVKAHFPRDLAFKATNNRENFQGRFIVRHPWKGKASECKAAETYLSQTLPKRQEKEAQTIANLTGWDITTIRKRMNLRQSKPKKTSMTNQSTGSNQVKPQ
ncbi:MAG TPA: DUF2330 domain-containing protein [Leucothrix sp.]|nr:DUF2330 domain-containing protein [Leucothrix sp.]